MEIPYNKHVVSIGTICQKNSILTTCSYPVLVKGDTDPNVLKLFTNGVK